MRYSRFGEKTNNLQECLPPRQTRPKRNASGFEKDLVPGTDWMSVKAQKRNLDSEKEVPGGARTCRDSLNDNRNAGAKRSNHLAKAAVR